MQDTRANTLREIIEEITAIKITNPYPAETKELVGNGYTNNRAGKRKRLKELKKKTK